MNKELWQWMALLFVALGLVGFSAVVVSQGEKIEQLSRAVATISTRIEGFPQKQSAQEVPVPAQGSQIGLDGYQTIVQKTIAWNGKVYQFQHRCKGTVVVAPDQSIPFCIGDNELSILDPVLGSLKELKKETIANVADANVFFDAELIPSSEKSGNVLISYAKDLCMTTNDCGVGMPTNYVTSVYNLEKHTLKGLVNYPRDGKPVWNPSGTKAIFYPDTCGGAGCEAVFLGGYDLTNDKTKSITTVAGAANSVNDLKLNDVNGNALPVWSDIYWKNDTDFSASLVFPNNTTKVVTGKY